MTFNFTQDHSCVSIVFYTHLFNNDSYPILREEVEATIKSLKKGRSAGVDNISSELVQAGGEAMIDMLLIICYKSSRHESGQHLELSP